MRNQSGVKSEVQMVLYIYIYSVAIWGGSWVLILSELAFFPMTRNKRQTFLLLREGSLGQKKTPLMLD